MRQGEIEQGREGRKVEGRYHEEGNIAHKARHNAALALETLVLQIQHLVHITGNPSEAGKTYQVSRISQYA